MRREGEERSERGNKERGLLFSKGRERGTERFIYVIWKKRIERKRDFLAHPEPPRPLHSQRFQRPLAFTAKPGGRPPSRKPVVLRVSRGEYVDMSLPNLETLPVSKLFS
jgi:hypothetical protein